MDKINLNWINCKVTLNILDKPQQPKVSAVQRLKNDTLKRIHKSTEEEMRQKALDGKVNLGKKKRPAPTNEPDEDNDEDSSSESPAKKRKT